MALIYLEYQKVRKAAAARTADAQTQIVVSSVNASTSHYLVLGIGLAEGASQTTFDVTSLEETLASTLSALDSSQAAQLALEQRVAELERQLEQHSADAEKQTDLAVATLEETLASTRSSQPRTPLPAKKGRSATYRFSGGEHR